MGFVTTNFQGAWVRRSPAAIALEDMRRRPEPLSPGLEEQGQSRSVGSVYEVDRPQNIEYSEENYRRPYGQYSPYRPIDINYSMASDNLTSAFSSTQKAIIKRIRSICLDYGISPGLAARAARVLLGDKYISDISLPSAAPKEWSNRRGADSELTPIEFLNKYWGQYLSSDVLFQADLRRLDEPLFNAIKTYCRNHNLSLKNHLPPPSRTRSVPQKQRASVRAHSHEAPGHPDGSGVRGRQGLSGPATA
jgi:hypothetical protein